MAEPNKHCSSCGKPLRFLLREQIQLGKTGWFLGDLSNLLSGALDVDIWECPACGKLELYHQVGPAPGEEDHIAQTICPKCGRKHDLDDPKCPGCGLKNPIYE